ncbi:hypothetical protein [Methylocella tundrae]|uniref:Moybdenum cofactor oxidoreductase dimerisation domain-containing protein n=1 Tax=Methylocella tundrae TaxID=227605 RepID=A0A4U8Z5X7_METTU|nr:protein of unknown function [Methylocella tundrae]
MEHDPETRSSWTFWEIDIELPKGNRELAVRASDAAGQTRPALPDDRWNFKGYLAFSAHASTSRPSDLVMASHMGSWISAPVFCPVVATRCAS